MSTQPSGSAQRALSVGRTIVRLAPTRGGYVSFTHQSISA